MKGLRILQLLLLVIPVFMMSCATPPPAPPPSASCPLVDANHPRAKLVLGSEFLSCKIIITEPQLRKQGTLTQSVVTVQNLTDLTYNLEHLFEWEEESGFSVDDIKVWRRFTLTPHQIKKFTSTGPTPEATKIIFTIRYPNSKF